MSTTIFSAVVAIDGFDYLTRTIVFDEGADPRETRVFVEGIGPRAIGVNLDLSVDEAERLSEILQTAVLTAAGEAAP